MAFVKSVLSPERLYIRFMEASLANAASWMVIRVGISSGVMGWSVNDIVN